MKLISVIDAYYCSVYVHQCDFCLLVFYDVAKKVHYNKSCIKNIQCKKKKALELWKDLSLLTIIS